MLKLWRRIFGHITDSDLRNPSTSVPPLNSRPNELRQEHPEPELQKAVDTPASTGEALPLDSAAFKVGTYGEIIENSLPFGAEHPRKSELREIAKTFGVKEQVCPYCQIQLAKFPQRKTKCKACNGQIYSRKEPLSGEKRLLKESELGLWEELRELSFGSWDWWHNGREKILAAKLQLSTEWGIPADKISDGDAQWRIFTADIDDALSQGNLARYRSIKVEMVRHLMREEKYQEARGLSPECIYLAYAGHAAEVSQMEKDLDDEMQSSNPELAARFQRLQESQQKVHFPELSLYFKIFESITAIQLAFFKDGQVDAFSKVMPITREDAWARFSEDWSSYSDAIAQHAARNSH